MGRPSKQDKPEDLPIINLIQSFRVEKLRLFDLSIIHRKFPASFEV
jgi:hypothetical protein